MSPIFCRICCGVQETFEKMGLLARDLLNDCCRGRCSQRSSSIKKKNKKKTVYKNSQYSQDDLLIVLVSIFYPESTTLIQNKNDAETWISQF